MAEYKFKDLTVDNAFDFCDVLAVVGADQLIEVFGSDEIKKLQSSGAEAREVGVVIAMKLGGFLVKNVSKARTEIYSFFANCMEWDYGAGVAPEEVRKFKLKQFAKMVKEFAQREDLVDFFEEVAGLLATEQESSKS